jgi:hypothetical protein
MGDWGALVQCYDPKILGLKVLQAFWRRDQHVFIPNANGVIDSVLNQLQLM